VTTIRNGYAATVREEQRRYRAELASAEEQKRMGQERFERATDALNDLDKPLPL
jgi:hypothetical protein